MSNQPLFTPTAMGPSSSYGSMHDRNPKATFGYVTKQLDTLGLAYLHVVEPRIKGNETIDEDAEPVAVQHLRPCSLGKPPLG
ncbi:hypothetical protein [Pseudomonas sp. MWU13-2105]|uniref:hypothetical protein n=1 Tax=Pseudomonas sp. MWU13-2105 TaxID=2935074 RepID=UPI00200D61F3|nr:hypothetical protein [Pseudomonas sp. MWU13-2105]